MQAKDNKKFKSYMESLPAKDKVPMRNRIIETCDIHTMTYYNWTSNSCYIPEEKKRIIEEVAGTKIFGEEERV
jgi:hypothetical protein